MKKKKPLKSFEDFKIAIGGKFGRHSRLPVEEIKKMQKKYRIELLQPRNPDGELNIEFLDHYGAKNIRLTIHDVIVMRKKNKKYADILAKILKKQEQEKWSL